VISVFIFFWCIALRINSAEGKDSNALRNLLAFLQVFYLPIGVFFISKRIDRINIISSSGTKYS